MPFDRANVTHRTISHEPRNFPLPEGIIIREFSADSQRFLAVEPRSVIRSPKLVRRVQRPAAELKCPETNYIELVRG